MPLIIKQDNKVHEAGMQFFTIHRQTHGKTAIIRLDH